MRKLYTTLLLSLACLSGAWAQQDAIRVSNLNDFREALKNSKANIVLEDDIDFGGNYYKLFTRSNKFRGTIDGNKHSIKNFKMGLENDIEYYGLIQFAEGATFKNLTLDNIIVKGKECVAGLVGNSKNCKYENIYLKNSEITYYSNATYIGGLVYASDHDTFTSCTTDNNTSVRASEFAGGLVYEATVSVFTDCINRAEVSGVFGRVGGIVAYDKYSIFTRCVNSGYVHHASEYFKTDDELGGIVAVASSSYLQECINQGKLYCEDQNGGGIVGSGKDVDIINCLNMSQELMFSQPTCGGIIGYAENSRVSSCLSNADYPLIGTEKSMKANSGNNYRLEIGNHKTSDWVMNVSEKQMASGIVARWLNNSNDNRMKFKPTWYQIYMQDKYPHPSNIGLELYEFVIETHHIDGCVLISDASELLEFAKKVNNGDQFACAKLGDDIDLSSYDNWMPIGNSKNPFRGSFDGMGNTIRGLRVSIDSNDDGAGLFGVAGAGADIHDINLADNCMVSNTGDGGAAGILGRVSIGSAWGNVVIESCSSHAMVSGNKHAGAILGRITTSDKNKNVMTYINACYNMGKIYASEGNSGLLCGYTQNSGYITNSWAGGFIGSWKANDTVPYDSKNPSGEKEYFAGYDKNISIANCYTTQSTCAENDASQMGVEKIDDSALSSGELTYKLNCFETVGNLSFYQKIGQDAIPMNRWSGGVTVYAYLVDNQLYYTNDDELSAFDTYGPIRVKKDNSLALLDGDSKSTVAFDKEITVRKAEFIRKFKANVPSTLMLPFSAEIGTENHVHLFTLEEMKKDYSEEYEDYYEWVAVMKEVEDGKIDAYTPYLALFDEDTDVMRFNDVTLKPAKTAVTERDDWCFVGQSTYREITIDDFFNDKLYYYGYTGMEYDGFKLGQFAMLTYGASIAPFRCFLYYKNLDRVPGSWIDIVTKKASTRAMTDGDNEGGKVSREDMPEQIQIVLKGANGETGIGKIDTETGEFRFQGWYDLNGNRVEEGYQGVRVGGGKKVMIKEY